MEWKLLAPIKMHNTIMLHTVDSQRTFFLVCEHFLCESNWAHRLVSQPHQICEKWMTESKLTKFKFFWAFISHRIFGKLIKKVCAAHTQFALILLNWTKDFLHLAFVSALHNESLNFSCLMCRMYIHTCCRSTMLLVLRMRKCYVCIA